MTQQEDTQTYKTLYNIISTLMHGTITMRDNQNTTYSLCFSGEPEDEHQDILNKLNIRSIPKTITSKNQHFIVIQRKINAQALASFTFIFREIWVNLHNGTKTTVLLLS